MKLVSVEQMRAIEEEANSKGLSFERMMETAGENIAKVIINLSIPTGRKEILGLVGPGNNGGDTLVALAHLCKEGWSAHAYLLQRKPTDDPLLSNFEILGGKIHAAVDDKKFQNLQAILKTSSVILDGIFGMGIKLPIKENVAKILEEIKTIIAQVNCAPIIIGVDCPTGVDCETGEVASQTLAADITVTMGAVKQGLLKFPANNLVGSIQVAEIGDLSQLTTWQTINSNVADDIHIRSLLPKRQRDFHKGTFGTVAIIAGSNNFTGAALMAGKAAAKTGVGLVTMAVPTPLHSVLAGHFPDATWILLPHELGVIAENAVDVIKENISRATAILIGPGIGTQETTITFLTRFLSEQSANRQVRRRIGFLHSETGADEKEVSHQLPPLIVDADGLRILARIQNWFEILPPNTIITPHPGEMSILTSLAVDEIQSNRINIAREYSKKWGHTIVLKGALTVISSPDGRLTIIPIATAALAHAGSGDVLAGIISGYRAQGLESHEAAVVGAWIHGQAGVLAGEYFKTTASVLASDLIDFIGTAISRYH